MSDNVVDLLDLYVDLSDNFVVICMSLIRQDVFNTNSLTNEWVTSQRKDLTSQYRDLRSLRHSLNRQL